MPEPASHPFVKYVSAVVGHHVARYGTGAVIGGRRQPAGAGSGQLDTKAVSLKELLSQRGAGKLEIDEGVIVALTADEWAKHWRAYGRALRKGALRERKATEYWAMVDRAGMKNSLAEGIGKMPTDPPPSGTLPRTAEETEAMCEPIGLPADELAALRAERPLGETHG